MDSVYGVFLGIPYDLTTIRLLSCIVVLLIFKFCMNI